jgi:hypothetical protein
MQLMQCMKQWPGSRMHCSLSLDYLVYGNYFWELLPALTRLPLYPNVLGWMILVEIARRSLIVFTYLFN